MCSARPPDAPKLGLYALKIGHLEVRRFSESAKKYCVLATREFRDELPQSHQRGVNDFQAAILLSEELAIRDFSSIAKACLFVNTNTLYCKIGAVFSLCISVGALLYKGDTHNEWQIRKASRSATEAHRILSTLKTLSTAHIQIGEDHEGGKQFLLGYKIYDDFNNAVSELDTVIADLAACSLDLQMLKIM